MATNATSPDARLIEMNGKAIFANRSKKTPSDKQPLLDNQWAKQAFLVSDSEISKDNEYDIKNRYWSSASSKFTDTRIGGALGINARPSFTRYSDVREKGRLTDRADVSINNIGGNHGMGRYYSEAIDDNAQTIYLRMGVPQFNSLMNFFSKAFDKDATALARTGRGSSIFYNTAEIAGTIAAVFAFPAVAGTILVGKTLAMFFTKPTSKFYTVKPSMHTYWSTVEMLANTIAINKGILPRIMDDAVVDQKIGTSIKFDKTYLDNLHALMPDMFTDSHGFNVFAIANKAQRVANELFKNDYEALNKGSEQDYTGYAKKSYQTKVIDPPGERTLSSYINKYLMSDYYKSDKEKKRTELSPNVDEKTGEQSPAKKESFLSFFDAEYRQGSQFAMFKVDHTGTVQESFANSAVESDLSNKFNSTSSQVREARFSFADGNLTDGVIGSMIGGAIGAVSDVVSGAANGLTMNLFSSLAGLAGSGFIDIPKHWQSSTATLPQSTYTMQLISPYNNPISQMQNIFIPLAMIMACSLPLSTGKQSYTSPFLIQLFDRGRNQIQMGLMQSLNISRGTSNLPFTNRGTVLAIDVSFNIVDLSSLMHMPISTGSIFGANMTMDEDNILMDYLAVLAGQDIYSQIYALPKAKLNLAKRINSIDKLTNPAYWASLIHSETTTGMLSYITPGKILDGLVAGTSTVSHN
jgi:hypothetical protein